MLSALITLSLALGILAAPAPQDATAADTLKVLATLPTYGALARELGADLVDVEVLTRPGQDVHTVAATPSTMARVRDADLLLHTGLDAEPWLADLLRGSGNTDLLPGSPQAVAMSDGIALKEVPAVVSRAQGDLHAFGNTHVWADPYAVRGMAAAVRDALVAALPEHAGAITQRHKDFHRQLTQRLVDWLTRYKHLKGVPVVVYHKSWPYFLDRFGLVRVGTIEPKPRVAPTASHLDQLIRDMRETDVSIVIREPYQHPDASDFVARETGARVLELSTHPGFPEGTEDILDHFDYNLRALDEAWRASQPGEQR